MSEMAWVQAPSCPFPDLQGLSRLMFPPDPSGADPEDVITGAFKVLDPEGKGTIKKQL